MIRLKLHLLFKSVYPTTTGRLLLISRKQCAGNRRDEMSKRKETEGLGWGTSVIA